MTRSRHITVILIVITILAALACSRTQTPSTELLGLRVGMDRAAAQTRLSEISQFLRIEGRNQELWKLNDASRFATLAVGYTQDKIRYVTAFVDPQNAAERVPFSAIGDLGRARAQIMEPHFRYIWDVPESGGNPACTVNVYGDNPEFVTIYTLVERHEAGVRNEVDEDDD